MVVNYRVEVKELGMYSLGAKLFKNGIYLGNLDINVNDTSSLEKGKSYEYNSRTNVDSITFGLQMELKKFLIDESLEASNKAKGNRKTTWTYQY